MYAGYTRKREKKAKTPVQCTVVKEKRVKRKGEGGRGMFGTAEICEQPV